MFQKKKRSKVRIFIFTRIDFSRAQIAPQEAAGARKAPQLGIPVLVRHNICDLFLFDQNTQVISDLHLLPFPQLQDNKGVNETIVTLQTALALSQSLPGILADGYELLIACH